jgi:hypothetical protein
MSERRSEAAPPYQDHHAPCDRCGYVFDHGAHGARMCPKCVDRDWDALDFIVAAVAPTLRARVRDELNDVIPPVPHTAPTKH